MNLKSTKTKRYSPRWLARSVARRRMEKDGRKRINKKRQDGKSLFQKDWRNYVFQRSVAK